MICNHCGRTLENEAQLFCAFCGYPVGDVKKGFFAKMQETDSSAVNNETTAPQSAMAQPAQPVPQPMIPQGGQMSMPIGMMGMMPQMSMMQNVTGVQGVQGMMPYMGMMPNMMANPVNQMSVMQQGQQNPDSEQDESSQANQQQAFQNPMMMGVTGMPQMMGYDTNGNPIYIQMMPQVMGYDPYGNPIYAMIPVPCAMPQMQTPSKQGETSVPKKEEKKTPSVSVSGRAVSQPLRRRKEESVSQKPKEQPPAELPEEPKEHPEISGENESGESSASQKPRVANAQGVGHPIQEGFFARQVRLQNPASVANGLAIKTSEKPHTEPAEEKPKPEAENVEPPEEVPVSADVLMLSEESQQEKIPDEQELLDSIFSNRPKKYTMSEGVEPSSQTFSINLSASEVTSVRRSSGVTQDTSPKPPKRRKQEKSREEWIFSEEQEDLPPPKALFDKPPHKNPSQYGRSGFSMSRQVQPPQNYPPQGSGQQFQPQPYTPQQGNSQQFQAQPYPPQQGNSWQYQQTQQPYTPQQGNSWQYQQTQPYTPQQGNSYQYPSQSYQPPQGYSNNYPQQNPQYQQAPPYPQQGAPPPEQQSQYFQNQISARPPELSQPQTKIKPTKVSRPEPKEEKPPKHSGKKTAKIVDAAEFFGDAPKVKSRGDLGVTAIDNMTDEQLAAQLAKMEQGGRKKSRRSMKAASELEADFSNIPTDMLPTDN